MKKLIFLIILIISLIIIKNLVFSIYGLWQKQDVVIQTQKELEAEKKKNKELKNKLSEANSPQFIEEQARNKLFLVKQGEQEIVLPKTEKKGIFQEKTNDLPNWKKWLNLFVD